eukprot:TRINITY_DN4102_c0_g1_i24.p1 TRINITY_DN4102_c0_g1~~TRINITY_DN4102_c0_g1_i24.p1  ORF type:complete len:465 (-),score=115.06 TRINITY_DN4102_c0_g1_i24:183-1577(-)
MTRELAELVTLASSKTSVSSTNIDHFIKTLKEVRGPSWEKEEKIENPISNFDDDTLKTTGMLLVRSPTINLLSKELSGVLVEMEGVGEEVVDEENVRDEEFSSWSYGEELQNSLLNALVHDLLNSSCSTSSSLVESESFEIKPGEDVILRSRIGRGASATVWHAEINQRDVALKQISLKSFSEGIKFAQHVTKREYDIVRNLKHPNIIKYYGFFYDASRQEVNLVMQLVPGVSVGDLTIYSNGLSEELASHILHSLLTGLNYLHQFNIIHRDVKPDNVLVSVTGIVKIIDFGTCTNSLRPTSTIGTPWYCAPEVINGEDYGTLVDIWSLGCFGIELLTVSPPYRELNNLACLFKMASGAIPPLPSCSETYKQFLLSCFLPQKQRSTAKQLLQHSLITNHLESSHLLRQKLIEVIKEMQHEKTKLIQREIITLTQQLIQVPLPSPTNTPRKLKKKQIKKNQTTKK